MLAKTAGASRRRSAIQRPVVGQAPPPRPRLASGTPTSRPAAPAPLRGDQRELRAVKIGLLPLTARTGSRGREPGRLATPGLDPVRKASRYRCIGPLGH